jgi:hypothetical protein
VVLTRRVVLSLAVPMAVYASFACGAYRSKTPIARDSNDRPARMGASRHVLSAAELKQASGSNALEIVQQLRPNFLRGRGSVPAVTVFVDHVRFGGINELRLIRAASILEIRYLDARAATQQFGPGYSGGVIHVLTPTGPR